ncbi:MAG TPA: ABC transporter ATP-binding protein, partial [Chloroflexota bacterium]
MMRMGGMGMMGGGMGNMMRGGGPGVWATEKVELKTPLKQLLGRIGEMLGEHKRMLFSSMATLIIASALQMVPPYLTRYVVDHVIPDARRELIPLIVVGLVLVHAVRYGLMYVSRIQVSNVSQQLVYAMAKRLFEHIQRLSLKFFEREGTGEIIS